MARDAGYSGFQGNDVTLVCAMLNTVSLVSSAGMSPFRMGEMVPQVPWLSCRASWVLGSAEQASARH